MNASTEAVVFSLSTAVGAITAIVVPILLWCWRVSQSQKRTLEAIKSLTAMHLDDDSVFSTTRTNELLDQHMKAEENMHHSMKRVLGGLDNSMSELAHYIKRLIEVQTGNPEPPFDKRSEGQ